jgi:hypothetical protein
MTTHVIYDPVTGDRLSVPMTLAQCKYIETREYEAQGGGDAWAYAITSVSELPRIQSVLARRMSGNPPHTRIIYDDPWDARIARAAITKRDGSSSKGAEPGA